MNITKKCIISTLLGLMVFGLFLIMSLTKSKNSDIIFNTKTTINQKIDDTNNKITNQMCKTAAGDFNKKNVIASAKEIQKEIKSTAKDIKDTIEVTSNQVDEIQRQEIKSTINRAKTSIKEKMKTAFKEIRRKIIRMLRGKTKNNIVVDAWDIKSITDRTCEEIKTEVTLACNEIGK